MTDFAYDKWPSREPTDWKPAERGTRPDDQHDFHVDLGCGTVPKGRIAVDRFPAPGVNVVADLDAGGIFAIANEPGRDAVEKCVGTEGPRRGERWEAWHRGNGESWDYPPFRATAVQYLDVLPSARMLGWRLPFLNDSIQSIVSHHCLEHIGEGFIGLMDDCYRVLEPGGIFRIIVPLFPSTTAVEDPDHKRYFMAGEKPEDAGTFQSFCGFPHNHWMESFSVPYSKARFELTDKDMSPRTPADEMWTPDDRREIRVTLKAVK